MNSEPTDIWTREVLEMHRRSLLRYFLAATGNMAATEDLAQETLITAYRNRGKFTPGTNLGGWLRGIARNMLKRHFEKQARDPILMGDACEALEQAAADNEDRMTDDDFHEHRLAALAKCRDELGEDARRLLLLRYGQGVNAREVARRLKLTVTSVNVKAFRLRAALMACIEKRMATA